MQQVHHRASPQRYLVKGKIVKYTASYNGRQLQPYLHEKDAYLQFSKL